MNIPARKQGARNELDTHTQLLELAARLAGLGHWHYGLPSGRIIWSDEVYRIHGIDRSRSEPDYRALLRLYEPGCAARLSALVERAIATGEGYEFEGVIRRPDGEVRNVAAKAQCRLGADGKVEEIFGVFQDVTEQTRTRRFVRTLADQIPAIVAYWDLGQRCRYANLQCQQWFGRTPDEMDGIRMQELLGPELFSKNKPFLDRAYAGEPSSFEPTIVKLTGEVVHTLARYIPDTDARGSVQGVIILVQDVTSLKEAELQLREMNDVARKARETAEQALSAKQAFLANISHELRNPLTSVIGFADLLARDGGLNERAAAQLNHIRSASETLLRTVGDLLELSRLDAGHTQIELRLVDPRALAADTLEFHRNEFAAKNLAVSMIAGDLPAAAMIDPLRVRQVLANFIGNAIKFTDRGTITLVVSYDFSSGLLSFEVQDTGVGIAPEHHDRIFQRFSQIDGGLNRRQIGAGLGLSICRGLAEAMGGEVSFTSQIGEGSCFRLLLPAPAPERAPTVDGDTIEPAPLESLSGFRLLVVDDHKVNRVLVRQMLEPFDVSVSEATDALEAVGHASAEPFDLVLLDLMMPDIDGIAAAPMIRACPLNQATPIVAFTAVSESYLDKQSPDLFNGVLTKPIVLHDLLELLMETLHARARQS